MSSIKHLEIPATCRLCAEFPMPFSIPASCVLWLWPQLSCSDHGWANETLVTGFVFLSFSSLAGLQRLLFAVFLLVYLFMLGTKRHHRFYHCAGQSPPHPHVLLLSVLSCSETCYTFVIVPKMYSLTCWPRKTISFLGCAIQMFPSSF